MLAAWRLRYEVLGVWSRRRDWGVFLVPFCGPAVAILLAILLDQIVYRGVFAYPWRAHESWARAGIFWEGDLVARMRWGSGTLLLWLACCSSIVGSVVLMRCAVGDAERWRQWMKWTGQGALALLAFLSLTTAVNPDLGEFFVPGTLLNALQVLPSPSRERHFVPGAEQIATATNALVAVAVLFLCTAASSTLCGSRRDCPIIHLHAQQRRLAATLYLASTLLVLGLFTLHSLFTGAVPYLDPQTSAVLERVSEALTAVAGVVFTSMLLLLYLPTALILQYRARRLAIRYRDGVGMAAVNEWLERQGLASQPWPQGARILAIMAPSLAPLLPEIPQGIVGLVSGS